MFHLDYDLLSNLSKETYKYSEVKDKLTKVAFDIVRFTEGPADEFWEIQSADDGDYIVARYNIDEEEPVKKAASVKNPWEAVVKQGSNEVELFYKGASFTKFAHADAGTIKNFLPNKLSNDQHFVEALFGALSPERQQEVKKLYPELF